MSDDDPVYQHRRTIKESVEHLKKMIETMPKTAIDADWERLVGTQRVRHKPSGCVFEWFWEYQTMRGREVKALVVNLVDFPEAIAAQELQQIADWANGIAAREAILDDRPRRAP